jgi:uncharacterized protein YdhG (YjbR/CyaY superfamily)
VSAGKDVTVREGTPTTVEEYLSTVPERARPALERLRATLREVVPEATESISYRIPTFDYKGHLVAFSAHTNHYSLHLMSPALMEAHRDELKGYTTTTATIQFPYDQPLDTALVQRLVKARVQEVESKQAQGYRGRAASRKGAADGS